MAITHRALAKGSTLPKVDADVIRLYSMRFCPFAQRTRIVLLHKKVPHEVVNCDLKYKAPWLLERNPRGLVPVIEYSNHVVYESAICGDFLDDLVPTNKLNSASPFQRSADRQLMDLFDTIPKLFYRVNNPDENKASLARQIIGETLDRFEEAIGDKKYFGGNQPCMVDYHIFPWFERIPAIRGMADYNILPKTRYPRLDSWVNSIQGVPAVRDTMLPTEWHMQFIASLFMKNPNYDIGLEDPRHSKL